MPTKLAQPNLPSTQQKTICTTLTPKGRGAVAVVAIAGPSAETVIDYYFRPANGKPYNQSSPRKIVYGIWKSTGEDLIVYRRGQASFEVHCHGGNSASAAIIANLQSSQIELVASAEFLSTDLGPADSNNSAKTGLLKTEVLSALSNANTNRAAELLLAQVNLLPQAIDSIDKKTAAGDFEQALKETESILAWAEFGIHLSKPRSIVLCGRPNVGKSSLINAIAGFQRAIVHDVPGTTRDVVTQLTAIDGWPVELKDTAGLRESQDRIESIGIEKAKEQIENAQIKICVFDISMPWNAADQTTLNSINPEVIVHNKCDVVKSRPDSNRPEGIFTSTETSEGVEQLIQKLGNILVPELPSEPQAFPVSNTQVERLKETKRRLQSST